MPQNILARCVAAVIVGPAPPHVMKDDEEKNQVHIQVHFISYILYFIYLYFCRKCSKYKSTKENII